MNLDERILQDYYNHSEGREPERLYVVMYIDENVENWSDPVADRYEAEQIYWSAKDAGENVSFGYTYKGRFNSRYANNIKEFREVKI